MSQIELLLLGMLIEKPQSAYDLHKDIEYHKLSCWTKISVPSVYKKVLQLKEQGYLQGETIHGQRRADKVIYTVTPEGRAYFEHLMDISARRTVGFVLDFNVVVANLNKLELSKAESILGKLQSTLKDSAKRHDGYLQEYAGEGLPLAAQAILEQQKQLYDTLLTWMDTFACRFREEGRQNANHQPENLL